MARKKKKKYQVTRSLAAPAFIGLICLFTWTALLTFDIADWPNPSHAPHNQPTTNACGNAGLPAMATAVQAIRAAGIPMQLDFRIAEDARNQKARGKLCVTSFTISGSGTIQGGASGVGGGATVGGSVTFGRCKK